MILKKVYGTKKIDMSFLVARALSLNMLVDPLGVLNISVSLYQTFIFIFSVAREIIVFLSRHYL